MDLTEKLITLVQQYPCLYDHREKEYKNATKKAMLWEKIAKQLNQDTEIVKIKWKNLKDGYAKYKKSGDGKSIKKKLYSNWVWGPSLFFLDGAIQLRNKFASQERSYNGDEEDESNTEENIMSAPDVNTFACNVTDYAKNSSTIDKEAQFIQDPLASTSRGPRKRPYNELEETNAFDKVLEYLAKEDKKDSVDHLFASYAKSLKQMKPATQAFVKVKLAQVFAEAELQDMQTENQLPIFAPSNTTESDVNFIKME